VGQSHAFDDRHLDLLCGALLGSFGR
jgi:hypothetical protein